MFYPYLTVSAAQVRESDDLRHVMLRAKNLGIPETTKDSSSILQK